MIYSVQVFGNKSDPTGIVCSLPRHLWKTRLASERDVGSIWVYLCGVFHLSLSSNKTYDMSGERDESETNTTNDDVKKSDIHLLDKSARVLLLKTQLDLQTEIEDEYNELNKRLNAIKSETEEEVVIQERLHVLELDMKERSTSGPVAVLLTTMNAAETKMTDLDAIMRRAGKNLLDLVTHNTNMTIQLCQAQQTYLDTQVQEANDLSTRYTAKTEKAQRLGEYSAELKTQMEKIQRWGKNSDAATSTFSDLLAESPLPLNSPQPSDQPEIVGESGEFLPMETGNRW